MGIWFSRYADSCFYIRDGICTMKDPLLEKLLSLIMALSIIVALAFTAMILIDLNDLWSEIIKYQEIIQSQNDKIRDLQILVISKLNIGTGI